MTAKVSVVAALNLISQVLYSAAGFAVLLQYSRFSPAADFAAIGSAALIGNIVVGMQLVAITCLVRDIAKEPAKRRIPILSLVAITLFGSVLGISAVKLVSPVPGPAAILWSLFAVFSINAAYAMVRRFMLLRSQTFRVCIADALRCAICILPVSTLFKLDGGTFLAYCTQVGGAGCLALLVVASVSRWLRRDKPQATGEHNQHWIPSKESWHLMSSQAFNALASQYALLASPLFYSSHQYASARAHELYMAVFFALLQATETTVLARSPRFGAASTGSEYSVFVKKICRTVLIVFSALLLAVAVISMTQPFGFVLLPPALQQGVLPWILLFAIAAAMTFNSYRRWQFMGIGGAVPLTQSTAAGMVTTVVALYLFAWLGLGMLGILLAKLAYELACAAVLWRTGTLE